MLNFIGIVVTAALMMVVANALITFMDFSRAAKMPVGGAKMSRPFICLLAALLLEPPSSLRTEPLLPERAEAVLILIMRISTI